jgi:hypothetical protein
MSLQTITGAISPSIEYFDVIKAPPSAVPIVDYIDDSRFPVNNLRNKFFQFRYRFVYDDNEKSVWSAISKMPIQSKSTDTGSSTQGGFQNAITIIINTGGISVSKIEIAGRTNIESLWSDFFLVDTIDKQRENIKDNIEYTYTFRNDSAYNAIDLQENNLLFDYVPDEANALELANGNTLIVGGLKDGYNRDTKLDVTLTSVIMPSPAVISDLSQETRNASDNGPFTPTVEINADFGGFGPIIGKPTAGYVKFSGTPQVGDEVTIKIKGMNTERYSGDFGDNKFTDRYFDDTWSVSVQSGWGIDQIIQAFIDHPDNGAGGAWNVQGEAAAPVRVFFQVDSPIENALPFGITNATGKLDRRRHRFESVLVTIKKAYSFNESDCFPTLKWSGIYRYGIAYYDKNGKTNSVFTHDSMVLRTSSYNTSYIWTPEGSEEIIPENETCQMYIGHTPPPWAEYYHIVRTKDLSCDFSLMILSPEVLTTSSPIVGYWYISIDGITTTNTILSETSQVLNYGTTSFVIGDRIRILQKYGEWSSGKFIDLPIIGVESNDATDNKAFIKVKAITVPFGYVEFEDEDKLIIEIYRPSKVLSEEDLVYYEIGQSYKILSNNDGVKYHSGQQILKDFTLIEFPTNLSSTQFISETKSIVRTNTSLDIDIEEYNKLFQGDILQVSGTFNNNGTYTVDSVTFSGNSVYIKVIEPLVNESSTTFGSYLLKKISKPGVNYAYINLSDDGDYYYRKRIMSDAARANGEAEPDYNATGVIYIVDKNFAETYLSAVWGQGRPLIVDEDIKEEYFPAMIRFSQSYIYGTSINNTNRFYPNNFEEADASFGDILRLKTRENFIRLFQRYKTGMIPIYRQIIIDNAQSSQVALSERLLNKPNYYSGEYGIDKYGSSLVSTDYGDYFIDTNNKAIVRVSLDGITNISDTNNLSFWANQNIKETSYGYGCFNYENRNVIILVGHLEPNEEDSYDIVNKIVAYSESDKKFESFYGFTDAENMLFINGFLFTGYQGKYYIHDSAVRNNFYGEQQSSSVTTVFNGSLQLKKTYTAIEELSNGLWTGTITTGPLTNQETNLVLGDFQKKIGSYTINSKENKFNATIKRDVNSAGGKFQGDTMKGLYAQLALTNSLTTEQRLISVSLKYIPSPLTNM